MCDIIQLERKAFSYSHAGGERKQKHRVSIVFKSNSFSSVILVMFLPQTRLDPILDIDSICQFDENTISDRYQ